MFQDQGYSPFMSGVGYFIIIVQVVPALLYIGWFWQSPSRYEVYNKELETGKQ